MRRFILFKPLAGILGRRGLATRVLEYDSLITSPKNEKYKLFKTVRDSARARKKTGLRLFEGYRLVEDALLNGFAPAEVFMSEELADSQRGKRIMNLLTERTSSSEAEVRPHCVEDWLLGSLGETAQPQSIFALFKVPEVDTDEAIDRFLRQRQRGLRDPREGGAAPMVLVCDGVSDPGNLGTLMRSGVGFGADAVIAIAGCDPWASKTVRASMGSCLRVPIVQLKSHSHIVDKILRPAILPLPAPSHGEDGSEGSAGALTVYVASAQGSAATAAGTELPYDEADFTVPFALVVGSEAQGVSPQLYKELSKGGGKPINIVRLYIPFSVEGMNSYNAAMAGSVIMSEAARQRRKRA